MIPTRPRNVLFSALVIAVATVGAPLPVTAAAHGVSGPPIRMPITTQPRHASTTAATSQVPLTYGGGAVQVTPSVFLSFWGPQWQTGFSTGGYSSATAQTYLQQFFGGVGGGSWMNSMEQYCQGAATNASSCPAGAQAVTNPAGQLKGAWVDATAVPTAPGDPDIQAAAERAFAHFGVVAGATYLVLTPTGHSESGFGTQWCAWHSSDTLASGKQVAYAYVPYMPDAGAACGMDYVNSTNDAFGHGYFDGYSLVAGHEYAEAVTDPNPSSGWTDANGDENADKCQWSAGPAANTTVSTGYFAVQSLWSDAASTCVLSSSAPTPAPAPTPTPTPAPVPGGAPSGVCVLDGFGGLHPTVGATPACGSPSAYWGGWDIARALGMLPDGSGGYVLDGFGGLHQFGAAIPEAPSAYWGGWDIARGITMAPWATATDPEGWVLDGFGGVHPFGGAPAISVSAYWAGWDIANALVIGPTSTRSSVWGYTMDGFGGLHPFGGAALIANAPYWPGWDIARGVQLTPGTTSASPSGYLLDGFGGVHGFGAAGKPATTGYWPGWDIARGITLVPGSSTAGYVLDGFGGVHAFGGAPGLSVTGYWPGWDIAHSAGGAGQGSSVGWHR